MHSVSIVTPTYNSMRTLKDYYQAILLQEYPHDRIELLIADGGSTDGTLQYMEQAAKESDIAIRILTNPLRTAEAGKAVGVNSSNHDIVCLLDSDNIIPDKKWMERMLQPFESLEIIASEPIEYSYRKEDSTINRYCSLIGMNDPLCLFTGNYDRRCYITGKWTEVEREEIDCGDYLSVKFKANMIPTIGANGFFMRRKELLENFEGEYLFDIDVLWELFLKKPELRVAKVKTGIVHLYCPNVKTFYKKQNRRIRDFLYFSDEKGRKYPWSKMSKRSIIVFSLCCITIVPLLVQTIIGQMRKPDSKAWLFHPVACWITLWVYGIGVIGGIFYKSAADRDGWKQ